VNPLVRSFVHPLFRPFLLLSPLAAALPAQEPPSVEVPAAPNASCPIMGKKVSLPLFVDTELGRIWVCCKPCFKKVLANVPKAHQTAYPVVAEVKNTICPVSGEAIGKDAVVVTLQATRFSLCCGGCLDTTKKDAQVVLARLAEPKLVDLGNDVCPVRGTKTAPNAFAVVDGHVVRLADAKAVEDVKKDPAAVLAKGKQLAAGQPAKPKHVHQPAPAKDAPKTEAKPDAKDGAKAEGAK
jgi:hypothetical protein